MTLYFVAGEASGDTHGAALLRALRASDRQLRFVGRGGPRMKEVAGAEFLDWSEHSAVLGLWEVLKQYGYFRREFHAAIREIRDRAPAAVVLVDYPGFNLRLARALRTESPRLKIIYYISPQVWAWNRRRIPQMAGYLDLMLCIFPFEAELYNQSGLRTRFVGHPMLESIEGRRLDSKRDPNLIALLPGSRAREVRKILPIMLKAAEDISAAKPDASFEIAAANEKLAAEIRGLVKSRPGVRVTVNDAAAALQRAEVGMIASGTATLEAAIFRLPFVLIYRVAWLTYVAARLVVRVKHLGMPNVLAGREIVPEFIQHRAKPRAIGAAVVRLMDDAAARAEMLAAFDGIVASLGREEASLTAARAILEEVGSS
jgi:lipid-A-disaccharide synthase